jgi:apolipoprotein D and lipocalin family protein
MQVRLSHCSALLALVFSVIGCSKKEMPPPKTAADLDVGQYMGVWHEIARLPFPFEEGCYGVSAKYEPLNKEEFLITNYCWEKSFFGPMRRAQAEAWIEDADNKSKFKVSFFWPFALDYWVLYVDETYTSALVGTPDRKYLWILSRSIQMEDAAYQKLVSIGRSLGYDISQLKKTPQRKDGKPPRTDEEKVTPRFDAVTQRVDESDGGASADNAPLTSETTTTGADDAE